MNKLEFWMDIPAVTREYEDPLEKEMTPHSSILAWRIPWSEEPDRLQSMGSQELDKTLETKLLLYLYSM